MVEHFSIFKQCKDIWLEDGNKNLTNINLSFLTFSTEQLNNKNISRNRQNTSNAKFQSQRATYINRFTKSVCKLKR